MFFSGTLGGDDGAEDGALIDFIGLKGVASGLVSAAPEGGFVYEAIANPADHARAREEAGGGAAATRE